MAQPKLSEIHCWILPWRSRVVTAPPKLGESAEMFFILMTKLYASSPVFITRATYIHIHLKSTVQLASQVALVVKNPLANAGDVRDTVSIWVGKIPWRRAWQPTPVFLPGISHGQRSLVGYSSQESQRVGQDWSNLAHMHTCILRLTTKNTDYSKLNFKKTSG